MRLLRTALVFGMLLGAFATLVPVAPAAADGCLRTPTPGVQPALMAAEYATGFQNGSTPCTGVGPTGMAFDTAGNLYVVNGDRMLYRFPRGGGVASSATAVGRLATAGIALTAGKDGGLYLSGSVPVPNDCSQDQIYELLPSQPLNADGTIPYRVAATFPFNNPGSYTPTDPNRCFDLLGSSVDPVTGDLFVESTFWIWRVSNYTHGAAGSPTVTPYAQIGGDGLTVAPDGTLYNAEGAGIFRIDGVNGPQPGRAVLLSVVGRPDGVAVRVEGGKQIVYVNNSDGDGRLARLDTVSGAVVYPLQGGSRGDFAVVGPDNCLYATQSSTIEKITNPDGSCDFAHTERLAQPPPGSGPTDTTPPVITGTATTQGGGVYTPGTWTNQPVTVAWVCTDEQGGSGVDTTKTTLQPTTVVTTSTAQVTSTGDCYDKAGNKAQPATFGPVNIDAVAPTITGAGTLPGGAAYTPGTWTNQPVSVAWTCADNQGGSGVATNKVSTPVTVSSEGTQSVTSTGDCIDNAGNKAQPGTLAVWYDKTPPVITGPANNGLYPVGQVPCITATDAPSGLAGPVTVTLDGATTAVDAKGCLTTIPVGQHTVTVSATDKAGNTTTTTTKFIVFASAGAGQFVLGDKTVAAATPSTTVTFWSAQWAKENSMSGGAGPNAFKGYDNSAPALACGAAWTTDPGNSSDPPATIPGYMAVIVSSHVNQSGSNIGGDIVKIVVVKTDAGYAGNPGHAGTGTIVGTYCG